MPPKHRALGRTVVVFGAGATKACGGPLTNGILPEVLALKRALSTLPLVHPERFERWIAGGHGNCFAALGRAGTWHAQIGGDLRGFLEPHLANGR
jgi:hypothetical protein